MQKRLRGEPPLINKAIKVKAGARFLPKQYDPKYAFEKAKQARYRKRRLKP
ncbi:MAG: hypothetical protein ACLQEQ_08940 [Nitrososphaerales archaeon]